jgi:hypothetical protein
LSVSFVRFFVRRSGYLVQIYFMVINGCGLVIFKDL